MRPPAKLPTACAAVLRLLGVATFWITASTLSAQEHDTSPARAALLSALVPGAGQLVLDQDRGWAYLAVEAVAVGLWLDRRSSALDLRGRYRDFAWLEARLRSEPRMDGDFEYYERMSTWLTSGLFDVDPATAGVQPEADAATFNGATWVLATQLFLPGGTSVPESDPRYQRALDYYRDRAYGPEFLWDWTDNEAAQGEFGSLIRRSDDRFRQATNLLGLVLVNHVVSMVDAFVSSRAPGARIRGGLAPLPTGELVWGTRLDLTVPW